MSTIMSLFDLPNECIYQVLSFLRPCDVNAVAQTCKCLHSLANEHLYSLLPGACSKKAVISLLKRDNVPAMRKLINHGINTSNCHDCGSHDICSIKMLHKAIQQGRLEIVKLFVKKDPRCVNIAEEHAEDFFPLVILTLLAGQVEIAKFLISRRASANPMSKPHQAGALCFVASRGLLPSVKYMVKKLHYDVNCFNGTSSPFYLAVENCHWDVAIFLFRAGADPFIAEANQDLLKLLTKTHQYKFNKALASLLSRLSAEAKFMPGLGWAELMGAADEKMIALIARRFEIYASLLGDVDEELSDRWIELTDAAATGGNESLLRKLLVGGILPGYTEWGLSELVEYSEEGPIDMDICPLLSASKHGRIGCVDALLEFVYKRSPAKIRLEAPWRAFKQAAKYKQYPLVNHLLERHHHGKANSKWLKMLQDDAQNEECTKIIAKYRLWEPVSFDRLRKCFFALCKCAPVSVIKIWLGILEEADVDVSDCAPTHTQTLGGDNVEIKIPVVFLMSECTVENLELLCKHVGFVICPRNPILKEVLSRAAEIDNEPLTKYFLNKGFDARLTRAKDSMTITVSYKKKKIEPPKMTLAQEAWRFGFHASNVL